MERRKGRHMKKKILAVVLSVALAMTALSGCGESKETGGRAETGKDRESEKSGQEKQGAGESAEVDEEGASDASSEELPEEPEHEEVTVCVKMTNYNSDGSFDSWYEYEYDAAGNQTKMTRYKSDGSVHYWYECEYITITLD